MAAPPPPDGAPHPPSPTPPPPAQPAHVPARRVECPDGSGSSRKIAHRHSLDRLELPPTPSLRDAGKSHSHTGAKGKSSKFWGLSKPKEKQEKSLESLLGKGTNLSKLELEQVRRQMQEEADKVRQSDVMFRQTDISARTAKGGHDQPTVDEIVEVLKTCSHWSDDTLRGMAKQFVAVSMRRGQTIFTTGDPAKHFFIIMEGEIELRLNGRPLCVRQAPLGFGFEAFEHKGVRSFEAFAKCDGMLLTVDHSKCQIKSNWFTDSANPIQLPYLLQKFKEGESLLQPLRATTLFAHLNVAQIRLLSLMCELRQLQADETLFSEGHIGDRLYIVVSGVAQSRHRTYVTTLSDANERGETQNPAHRKYKLVASSLVGVESIFEARHVSTETVQAVSSCEVAVLRRDQMRMFLSLYPEREAQFREILDREKSSKLRSSHMPLFERLDAQTLALIDELSTMGHLERGCHLFEKGQPGTCMYIIASGTVAIFDTEPDGSDRVIRELGPGEYFGELSLVSDTGCRVFGARAETAVTLITVDQFGFKEIFRKNPRALAELEMRILREEVGIETILNHPEACRAFVEHMKTEYAEEHVDFWLQCRSFYDIFNVLRDKFGVENEQQILCDGPMQALEQEGLLEVGPDFLHVLELVEPSLDKHEAMQPHHSLDLAELMTLKRQMTLLVQDVDELAGGVRQESTREAIQRLTGYMRRHHTLRIFNKYIRDDAPYKVNIDCRVTKHIASVVEQNLFPANIFAAAQSQVLELMKADVLARFKQGTFFVHLLEEVGAYPDIHEPRDKVGGDRLKEIMKGQSDIRMDPGAAGGHAPETPGGTGGGGGGGGGGTPASRQTTSKPDEESGSPRSSTSPKNYTLERMRRLSSDSFVSITKLTAKSPSIEAMAADDEKGKPRIVHMSAAGGMATRRQRNTGSGRGPELAGGAQGKPNEGAISRALEHGHETFQSSLRMLGLGRSSRSSINTDGSN